MEGKPKINIGTIGHVDHGKTTLTAAICAVFGVNKRYEDIDNSPEERARGITIKSTAVTYETENRVYSHVDCPGHADYIKNMLAGASNMDAGILVVSAVDGLSEQTKEHARLTYATGVKTILLAFTKMDLVKEGDEWLVEAVKEETVDFLHSVGFKEQTFLEMYVAARAILDVPGNDAQRAYAEQQKKAIRDLFAAYELTPLPERDYNGPFMMPIEGKNSIPGRGTVFAGKVKRGTVLPNDVLEVFGAAKKGMTFTVTDMEEYKTKIPSAKAGQNVGLLCRPSAGVNIDDVTRGMYLGAVGSMTTHKKVKVIFNLSTVAEGGRRNPIQPGYKPQVYHDTLDITASVIFVNEAGEETMDRNLTLMPGQTATMVLEFEKAIVINVSDKVILREGGKTIGAAIVIETL